MKYLLSALFSVATLVVAIPPGIPDGATAKSLLGRLTVAPVVDDRTYDRSLFPHWESIPNQKNCNVREWILRRDGDDVKVGRDCYPISGSWTCPYSGVIDSKPSDVHIDHMVPLKNAWISGASQWTTAERQDFANDLDGPQLWAVDGKANTSKGDKSPDQWKPPLASMHCSYASAWVQVKSTYSLVVTPSEKSALATMLKTC